MQNTTPERVVFFCRNLSKKGGGIMIEISKEEWNLVENAYKGE